LQKIVDHSKLKAKQSVNIPIYLNSLHIYEASRMFSLCPLSCCSR